MRLVFAGTPAVAVPSLQALLASSHEVVAVVTRPDAPAGRGRRLAASPVREAAEAAGVAVLTPRSPKEPGFLDALAALEPDCCPVVAYGALVPRPVLDVPRLGWVNLHFSLLPAWRGAAPVQRAVLAGDEVTGATTFLLEEGMDTGPVLGTLTETVRPTDTSGDLLDRLATAGAGLLVASLDGLEAGEIVRRAAAGRGRLARPEARPGRRPGRLARPRAAGGPARPGRHPRAGTVDDARRPPAQARPGAAGARGDRPRRRGGAGHQGRRAGRHRDARGRASARCSRRARARWPAGDWARGVRPDGRTLA